MHTYAFWNNKGGTGKTSIAFQTICEFAKSNPELRILVIDICPQANLSELFLGGLMGDGSQNLLARQGETPRATVGGYFQMRLPSPYAEPPFDPDAFLTNPSDFNVNVPDNILLLCGDPLLELQSNAISTLANNQIPGTNTWLAIADWVRDFIESTNGNFDIAFMDLNPSFSIYTQIAIATADRLVLPVMADDSSRRALQNAFSLIHGLRLPSPIYAEHNFATRLRNAERDLPKVHLIVKNRLTQYMGPASAYAAVLRTIDRDISSLIRSHPEIFTFADVSEAVVDVRDFQTTGVVAYARGTPFFCVQSGYLTVGSQRVRVNEDQRQLCEDAICEIAAHIDA